MNKDQEYQKYFPVRPEATPTIYAYEYTDVPTHKGFLKVGYTTRTAQERVAEQEVTRGFKYRIVFSEPAMYFDGVNYFSDHNVHHVLEKKGFSRKEGTREWFRCTLDELKAAYIAVRDRTDNVENRTESFPMRWEQEEAVLKAMEYYESVAKDKGIRARFLWNAKMRFGKTFAAYQLARHMEFTRVLILTFKPAVEDAWRSDLCTHKDFEGWQFISRNSNLTYDTADKLKPIVCFGSFQDYLGVDKSSGIVKPKPRNEWVHEVDWDLVIFDEYHFGAWRDKAQQLVKQEDEEAYDEEAYDDLYNEEKMEEYKTEVDNACTDKEDFLRIKTSRFLYLSGTPFRAFREGEFGDEQIYSWTYSDEQRKKKEWKGPYDNPYEELPEMVMMTYKIPETIREIALKGEFNEFDLNVFFSAEGEGDKAKFKHEDYVQKWLNLIRGANIDKESDNVKLGGMPFFDNRLLSILTHTLWFLPSVAACEAMENLLKQRNNTFFQDYEIIVCAGNRVGNGVKALKPVQDKMRDPLKSKTITLTCGKLTTGITVPPWTGIFMLLNLSSPETYFQSAFRVQSPWKITTDTGKQEIMKRVCYVFDFALDRALRQIYDYSCKLTIEGGDEKKVEEFLNFLHVIAYDEGGMEKIEASAVLEHAMSGLTESSLIRSWKSRLLVNVDNETLSKFLENAEAMKILMGIEQFRKLTLKDKKDFNVNDAIETIIKKSKEVKQAKANVEDLPPKEKKKITEIEKENKKKRDEIRERLIWFLNRIPIFMYLSEYRETQLEDVITQTEPEIFKRVTGMSVDDFKVLLKLNVFNSLRIDNAVGNFKRYEDSSLSYTGIINPYESSFDLGEYRRLYSSQQVSMERR